jgi:DNA-binding MarR family transcriptional regulator
MDEDDNSLSRVPEPGEGKRGESGYLGYLLRQASGAVRQGLERAFEDLGVTQPQFLVMTMINSYPGSSGADLARLAVLTPQTISVIVANLEKAGRLTRIADPAHGRIQRLELTDEGRTLLAQCRERARRLDTRLAGSLTPDEEHLIRRWLVDVARGLRVEGERSPSPKFFPP